MLPRLSVLTLAVDDLPRALAFYRDGLGWPTQGIIGQEHAHGAVVFFSLQNGLRLALWPRTSLAYDTGLPVLSGVTASLAHNVSTPAEVDAIHAQALQAGATQVKAPHPTFYGGYAAYFQDPDQHLWEIVHNPHLDQL
jgi:catechol 2,3-dioxygenase-like lactoylglutathione lyase family enzyme